MFTEWVVWLVMAVILAVAELTTGTFYLLIFAVGAGAGCIAAYAGAAMTVQLLCAAVVSLIGWFAVKKLRPAHKAVAPEADPNMNMDIGNIVRIATVDNGRITVMYRGTKWDASIEGDRIPMLEQDYVITKVRGAHLVLSEK
jgi:membrane protein implicated in regulation of membrane protease activity